MKIRNSHINDLPELQELFAGTIREVCKSHYSSEQIAVWISTIENSQRWIDMLSHQFVLVALDGDKITGFCTLKGSNYIDFLYVHKDYQRQGIAHRLFRDIEEEAKKGRQTQLTSDVSKTARPFFEKMGFSVMAEQTVERQGIKLINFKMIKAIENHINN